MEDDDLIMEDIYTYYDFGSDTMGGALQEQVKKSMSSQLTSDVEQLVERMKAEKAMASQLTSDVEQLVEPMKEEAEKKMSDVDHQMGSTAQLKGEEPKLMASEVASDVERLMEPKVPLKEEAQKVITSETSSDVDHPVVPMIPPKEEAQTPIASHASIEADHLMNLAALKQEQDENVMTSQLTSDDSQSNENVDLTASFTTDMVFDNREELIKWARDIGKTVGTVIVINKSDKSYSGRNPRICLGCERGGKYRVAKKGGVKPARQAGSKRCGCPFRLKGVKMLIDDQWKIAVVCGFHNHPIAGPSEGHSYAGKLTLEEKEYVLEMGKCGIKPKESLNALKERNVLNASKMTTIYNARASLKVVKLSRKSQMQQLMKKLDEHEYVKWHRHHDEDSVTDLFWAHPESIKLAKCFPNVFLMDCTYKQNRYRPSLLEIVGVTSTNKLFTFAFVYLEAEKEENYVWALDCMKSVLSSGPLPLVIVTDKEVPLMHAINRVFPEARNLLCRYRISRDLTTNCKKAFNTNEAWTAFLSRWNDLVCSATEEEYCARLSEFEGDFSEYPGALSYVKETWLSEYRDCFVAAWTDQNTHFGNTTTYRTTSRADNDQANLRRHLGPSVRNFNTMWSAINSLLLLQHTEINASFEESLNTVVHDYTSAIFEELRGAVSIFALELILMEVKRAYSVGPDDGVCGCVIRRTHELPCAHEISGYMLNGFPIPLSCVHPHWKQLTVVSTTTPQHELPAVTPQHHELYSRPEFQMLCQKYEEVSENVRLEILKRIKEVANFVRGLRTNFQILKVTFQDIETCK